MKERKTIKHAVYTHEEKEKILDLYLSGEFSANQLARDYDLGDKKKVLEWRDMRLKHGRLVDGRGRKVEGITRKGRPKSVNILDMNKDEPIKHIRMIEDIKKAMAYLRKRDPSIK